VEETQLMHDKKAHLPFAMPDIGEEEIAEVVDSLRSGWITTGPKAKRFEDEFAAFLGGDVYAVAVNSATAGLHLALEALSVGQGDEVITTSHTFTATAEVARYLGAELVFVDIDPRTYCIDPVLVEAAITERTKAIIPVHYAGLACDISAFTRIAQRTGIKIVEDAAHALPTMFDGTLVGRHDTACTVFSFYATKTLATGEGGMLVTRNADIAARARVMRLHGIDRDAFARYTSDRPAWYYEVVAPGFKYNMTDIAAAIGIHQLRRVNQLRDKRQRIADRYAEELRNLPLKLPPTAGPSGQHAWHLYVVQLRDDAGIDRDEAIAALYAVGVGCSVHYIPLHQQPYWRDRYSLTATQFPQSQRLYERGISLPIYSRMTDQDQTRVIDAIRAVLGKA
jgi:dTDP-4-amino-4,6-dideoxygalactose transaminase